MRNSNSRKQNKMVTEDNSVPRRKTFGSMLQSDRNQDQNEYTNFCRSNTFEAGPANYHNRPNGLSSDYSMMISPSPSEDHNSLSSPYAAPSMDLTSPLSKSPWSSHFESYLYTGLIGSLVREEGHIYSLAASGDLLYTGSDSKNIRVWEEPKRICRIQIKQWIGESNNHYRRKNIHWSSRWKGTVEICDHLI